MHKRTRKKMKGVKSYKCTCI